MPPASKGRRIRLAYFVNLFPNFIESMIYREVEQLRLQGHDMTVFSIRRPNAADVPAEAREFTTDPRYILSLGVVHFVRAHVEALLWYPVRYWIVLAGVLTGSHTRLGHRWRSLCHFCEGVAVLPVVRRLGTDHLYAH